MAISSNVHTALGVISMMTTVTVNQIGVGLSATHSPVLVRMEEVALKIGAAVAKHSGAEPLVKNAP